MLVEELTSQNARLTAQIEAANQMEAQLTSKLNEMKNQYSIQNNNLQVRKLGDDKTIVNYICEADGSVSLANFEIY